MIRKPATSPARTATPATGSAYTHLERIGRPYDGAAILTRSGSDLIVGTAPLDEIPLLLTKPEFTTAAYLLSLVHGAGLRVRMIEGDEDTLEAKCGESVSASVRLGRHLRHPPVAADRVWLIASLQRGGLGKDPLLALQHGLTQQAIRAGRCRVVGGAPESSWLAGADPGLMARWLSDARELLSGAGCHLLEPPGARVRPALSPAGVASGAATPVPAFPSGSLATAPLRSGYRLAPAGLAIGREATRHVLAWRRVRVTAFVLPDRTVLVEAGSMFATKTRSGVQQCIARKLERMASADLFTEAGDDTRRLTRAIVVTSLTNAARLATASNMPGKPLWRTAA